MCQFCEHVVVQIRQDLARDQVGEENKNAKIQHCFVLVMRRILQEAELNRALECGLRNPKEEHCLIALKKA